MDDVSQPRGLPDDARSLELIAQTLTEFEVMLRHVRRDGRCGRAVEAQHELIRKLGRHGWTAPQIATLINKSLATVYRRMIHLGLDS